MGPLVKVVVDELFAALEAQFAARPMILMFVHMLHTAAIAVLPLIVAKVEASPDGVAALKSAQAPQ